jgi:hypothetical protein
VRSRVRVALTERDGRVLWELARWGTMDAGEVAAWCGFPSVATCQRRLWQLTAAGFVRTERPMGTTTPAVYSVTRLGASAADEGDLPAPQQTRLTLPHKLTMPRLARALLAAHPGSSWTTERELRRDAMEATRDPITGTVTRGWRHIPDGVVRLPDGRRVAVELELSQKGVAEYGRVLRGFAFGLTLPDGERVRHCRWYSDRPAILRRLRGVVAAKRLGDVVTVAELPAGITVSRRK